jgi:YVTN family beta-propeller protein
MLTVCSIGLSGCRQKRLSWLLIAACGALDLALARPVPAAGVEKPGASTALQVAARLRYPVALALADGGRLLLAANERSGTISIVDLTARRVTAEFPIGKQPSDLVAIAAPSADGRELFVCTDAAAGRLYLLARVKDNFKIIDSLGVSAYPASVCVDKDGRRCFVASQWSRCLSFVDFVRDAAQDVRLKLGTVVPLPFAPRLQALSPDGHVLTVAAAFGGELAVVNVSRATVESVDTLPGQNIRGLAWSSDGRKLFVSHQRVNRLGYTSQSDLHWGSVVSNVIRSLERATLEQPKTDVLAGSQLVELGDVGNGAGDPAALAVMKDGGLRVALAGVGEVASGRFESGQFRRLAVGIRPTAVLVSPIGDLCVADTFGDSIAIVRGSDFGSPSAAKHIVRISLGPQPPLTAAERGERLFFDARLSLEKWMSCHSCHSDGHSSDALSDTLGDGSFGAAKRIPPLGGVAETGPWAWNGSVHDVSQQVRKSLQTTMRAKLIDDTQVGDLTAYLTTLKPAPPQNVGFSSAEKAAIERGHVVFTRHKCDQCHASPTFTSPGVYDVGVQDELGNRQFNPPSLRGVGQRAAFFHDGRATSLRDVFAVHRHPRNTQIPESELADLLAFLRSV